MLSVRKSKIFYLLTMVVFLANLVMPTMARAEGEPPIDPTAEETTAPADEATPEAPADDTTPPAPADPIVYDPSAPEMTADEAAQYLLPEPVLAAVGENTEVVVVDENGESIPLSTQAAADALIVADPIWCPGSQNPTVSTLGCSGSYTSLTALLTALRATYGTYYAGLPAGTIWIESGTYTAASEGAASIFINGIDPDNSTYNDAYSDLTIQGGWNRVSGTLGMPSTYTIPMTVIWGGNLTINNLAFSNTATFDPGAAYDPYAFQAVVSDDRPDSDKTLRVNGLQVTRATGDGARLTADGAVVMNTFTQTSGTQTHNQFNTNAGDGLTVDTTWASITLNDLTASYNTGSGAIVTSQYGDVTVGTSGSSLVNTFNNNGGYGLYATTDSRDICTGAYNWDAAANAGLGGWVWNRWTSAGDCNSGYTSWTGSTGTAWTDGWTHYTANIGLNNLSANSNGVAGGFFQTGGYGVYFQFPAAGVDFHLPYTYGEYRADSVFGGFDAYGQPASGSGNDQYYANYVTTGRGSITMSGTNQFNSNNRTSGSEGLWAHTWIGDISLNNLTVDSNNVAGADLRTGDYVKAGAEGGSGTINLTGANTFNNNQAAQGLYAYTFSGDINLSDTQADGNYSYGAQLRTGDTGYWDANAYNYWDGASPSVYHVVGGQVTGGGSINILDMTSAGTSFSGNSNNYGLDARLYGFWNPGHIYGESITADDNGQYGAYLYAPDGLYAKNGAAGWPPASPNWNPGYWGQTTSGQGYVKLVGENSFTNNGQANNSVGYGLDVWADGYVSLNEAFADGNGQNGAWLYSDNQQIEITGLGSTFSHNGWWGDANGYGLWAHTNPGVADVYVSTSNIQANDNNQYGAWLEALGSGGNVGIWGVNTFNENDTYGLDANADDSVYGENLTANYNGARVSNYGADLDALHGSVTLGGANAFDHNTTYGLNAWAGTDVYLHDISTEANFNTTYGANLYAETGSVEIYGLFHDFSDNGTYGLSAESAGDGCAYSLCNVEVENTWADDNGSYGAYLYADNDDGNVLITGDANGFNRNGDYGLSAYAYYDVSVDRTWADENDTYGAFLYADYGNVDVTNSYFSGNLAGNGLEAEAWGHINLTNVSAGGNSLNGAELSAYSGYKTPYNINVTSSNFLGNDRDGLYAYSDGDIYLNGVTANSNGWSGANLWAAGGTADVRSSTFNSNGSSGQAIYVDPVIGKVLNYYVTANENVGDGLYFYGYTGGWGDDNSDPADVALVCSIYNDNTDYGYDVDNVDGTLSVIGGESLNNLSGNYVAVLGGNDPASLFSGLELNCGTVPVRDGAGPGKDKVYEQGLGNGTQVSATCDSEYAGLQLNLIPGDFVLIPCSSGKRGSALTIPASSLPEMPESGEVRSALTFRVYNQLNGRAYVAFLLPVGDTGEGYSILFWKDGRWVNMGGHLTEDGYFQTEVNQDGLYILVHD